jgi:ribonuclease P protein subunit RPR2
MLRRGRRPKWMIDIAKERMDILFSLAEKEFTQYPHRAHRYVNLARKISKRYNTKTPLKWNRRFCKRCYKFLKPGKNSHIRLLNEEVHIKCRECGNIMRIPYKKEKKIKRRAIIESHIVKKGTNE